MSKFYYEEFVKPIKQFEDDEIKIVLNLAIPESKQYYYLIYKKDSGDEIGQCGLRLEENKANLYLGNIEYEIFEEYRGNNYAFKATKLLGNLALSLGVEKLSITANPNNIASIKTIQKLGSRFIELRKVPKKMRLYKLGNKVVAAYDWNIKHKTL